MKNNLILDFNEAGKHKGINDKETVGKKNVHSFVVCVCVLFCFFKWGGVRITGSSDF